MNNESITQVNQQLRTANNILVVIGDANNIDAVASGLSLREFLIKLEKKVTILSLFAVGNKPKFLPEATVVKLGKELKKNLVIDVSTRKNQIAELHYEKTDDKLSIFLSAKDGEFNSSDVNVRGAVYPFDLIVTLGVAHLEELGDFYAQHAQMFFDIPVINIDFRASNENYAQINLVDLTASALCEIIYDLLMQLDVNFITERIATLLLTGLTSQTNSFQSVKVSPQAFMKASKLIALGAKQQEIVTQLYRSKSLGFLRLWGRVLARIKQDAKNQLVYSLINEADIEKSEATPEDIDEIIFEMIQQLPFAKTFIFFSEVGDQTQVYAATTMPINLGDLFTAYKPQALMNAVKFTMPQPLVVAEDELIAEIQTELAKYSG